MQQSSLRQVLRKERDEVRALCCCPRCGSPSRLPAQLCEQVRNAVEADAPVSRASARRPREKATARPGLSNLLAEFGGVPEFAEFKRLLGETAADFGQNLPYRLDVDFSAYDPSNFFRSLRIHPTLSGEVRNFDELGTGQSQVLALAFAYAYAMAYGQSDGTILVVDEPEANLHPLAQQWLALRLNSLAAPGLQVVLTTHSPHFVDLARLENLVMVRKEESGATTVVQRTREELRGQLVASGAHAERTRADTIGPFYAAGATTEIVSRLFARCCVLVEGPTEALALPELLRIRGLDVLQEGLAVISVEGISNIAKWRLGCGRSWRARSCGCAGVALAC